MLCLSEAANYALPLYNDRRLYWNFDVTLWEEMKDQFYEFMAVLSYSWRTRWCLYVGVTFAIGMRIVGQSVAENFELSGPFAALTPVFQAFFLDLYYGRSMLILGASIWTAVQCYRRDRERLFSL